MKKEKLEIELEILKGIKEDTSEFGGKIFLSAFSRKSDFDKWDALSEDKKNFKLANKKVLRIPQGFLTTIEQVEEARADDMEYAKEDYFKPKGLPHFLIDRIFTEKTKDTS